MPVTMQLKIPDLAVVALVGATSSGKTTFARRHFKATEILNSDHCRGLVSDDENNQQATDDAFELLYTIARKRLARRLLTVIDATNVQADSRRHVLALAREYHAIPVAIVLDVGARRCLERNAEREDRKLGAHVIRQQCSLLRQSLRTLKREGFRYVYVLRSPEELDAVAIERVRLWTDRRDDHGPFDVIGDVHGCFDELHALLGRLGYAISLDAGTYTVTHPQGRRAVFLGDLVDRGPKVAEVLHLVMDMTAGGAALCVPGNHETKLLKHLRGHKVKPTHGLAETIAQLEAAPPELSRRAESFIDGLVSHYMLDDGKLVVAHAGLKETLQGRGSGAVREFALYGETTGETDEFGLPVRYNWASEYRGRAIVVYGHTPVPAPEWLNRTICVDTGCVYGGALTALRYPELELVSEPARAEYCPPSRPLRPAPEKSAQQEHDDLLDLADLLGRRSLQTRLRPNLSIAAEYSSAALEVMSRFAVDPRWLIYLPPTMSPSETSERPGLLEHPAEALAYYRGADIGTVVCEQKHMGSRAVVIVARSPTALRRRFGIDPGDGLGVVYTRTGRPFFGDPALEQALLARVAAAATTADLWSALDTDWLCLDVEVMPWSVKAQSLLRSQYAPTAAAGEAALAASVAALATAAARGADVAGLLAEQHSRLERMLKYRAAYRHYCWPVASIADLRVAPFHLLASEGRAHVDQNHVWHMDILARLCAADPALLLATPYRVVDLEDEASCAAAISWWEELTGAGGEGMVVKPFEFIARGPKGLMQPAIKCRGREYLRIIYGPEYTAPEHLERLRQRGLGGKRSLAVREFALGVEALERFVRGEPLRRVHECVFAVLALESEPVDPRL